MNFVNQMSDTVSDLVNNNKIINPILALLLVLYVVMAAPNLPKSVATFFNYPVVKFIYMFLIVYLASKERSPTVAILVVVALLVGVQALSYYDTSDQLVNTIPPTPNPTAAAVQAADAHQAATLNAINNGDLATAHAHAKEHSKYSMVAMLTNMVDKFKQIASTLDNDDAKQFLDKAATTSSLLSSLNNGKMSVDDVKSALKTLNNQPNVVGYTEDLKNEVYAGANSPSNIDITTVSAVEPSVETENFQASLPSYVNEMSVVNEFAPMNVYAPVELQKSPGNLGPWASFRNAGCDDNTDINNGDIILDNTDIMNNNIASDVLYNPRH